MLGGKICGTSRNYDKENSPHNPEDVKPMQMPDGSFPIQIFLDYGRTVEMAYRCVDKVQVIDVVNKTAVTPKIINIAKV